jgi:hypothetical protein
MFTFIVLMARPLSLIAVAEKYNPYMHTLSFRSIKTSQIWFKIDMLQFFMEK